MFKRTFLYIINVLLICILLILLPIPSAYSEKEWSFKENVFSSNDFSFKVPTDIYIISQNTDEGVFLHNYKEDMFLIIYIDKTDYDLDDLEAYTVADNEDFLADVWGVDPSSLKSYLYSVSRIRRDRFELLEYRFDVKLSDADFIGYYCYLKNPHSDRLCIIKFLANKDRASAAKLSWMNMIDSIKMYQGYDMDEWVCSNCKQTNNGKFCSNCGAPRDSESSDALKKLFEDSTDINDSISDSNVKDSIAAETIVSDYVDVVTVAKSVARTIAYNSTEPINGDVVKVSIGSKTVSVHSDFKYAMDVFNAFYKDYLESVKNLDAARMLELIGEADEVDRALSKVEELDLAEGDLAYYLYV